VLLSALVAVLATTNAITATVILVPRFGNHDTIFSDNHDTIFGDHHFGAEPVLVAHQANLSASHIMRYRTSHAGTAMADHVAASWVTHIHATPPDGPAAGRRLSGQPAHSHELHLEVLKKGSGVKFGFAHMGPKGAGVMTNSPVRLRIKDTASRAESVLIPLDLSVQHGVPRRPGNGNYLPRHKPPVSFYFAHRAHKNAAVVSTFVTMQGDGHHTPPEFHHGTGHAQWRDHVVPCYQAYWRSWQRSYVSAKTQSYVARVTNHPTLMRAAVEVAKEFAGAHPRWPNGNDEQGEQHERRLRADDAATVAHGHGRQLQTVEAVAVFAAKTVASMVAGKAGALAVGAIANYQEWETDPVETAEKTIAGQGAGVVGGEIGHFALAAVGTAVGTAIGGPVGAVVGEEAGAYAGDKIGEFVGEEAAEMAVEFANSPEVSASVDAVSSEVSSWWSDVSDASDSATFFADDGDEGGSWWNDSSDGGDGDGGDGGDGNDGDDGDDDGDDGDW